MSMSFNDKECQVLNFTDITTQKRLKHEEEKSRLLETLNLVKMHHVVHIFEPFYRGLKHDKLNPMGNGVGLSICKQIC